MLTGPSWLCSRSSLPSTNSRRGLSQAQSIHGSASGKRPEGCRPVIAGKADKSLQRHASSRADGRERRSEEHTSELQSLMRISYAVFCLKKKNKMLMMTQIMRSEPTKDN